MSSFVSSFRSFVVSRLMVSTSTKCSPRIIFFHFREQVEATGCQIRQIGRVFHGSDFVFGQKFMRNERCVRRCIVLMQDPRVLRPQFGSCTSHTFTQTLQDFNIEFCINSLTGCNIFMMNNSTNIEKKTMSMVLIFERLLRAFLVRGEPGCFHSSLYLFVSGSYS
jgi:hypothetical protein